MQSIKRKNKIKLLEYRLAFEESKQVKKEYEEGANDLNYRLSFFRKRLVKTQCSNPEVFDAAFMRDSKEYNKIKDIEIPSVKTEALLPKNNIKPWAKKLYRKIAISCHPDKISNISSKELKEKLTSNYLIATKSYEEEEYSDLLMIAVDMNIEIPEEKIQEHIVPDLIKKSNIINSTKAKIEWQWHHVPDEMKNTELKKILLAMGFEFSEDLVEEVNKRKKPKPRKAGVRPTNKIQKRKRLN